MLADSHMIRVLPPWFENIRNSGIMHALLQISTLTDLQGHPKLGSSWEGFCLENLISVMETRNIYFWATHAGAELDMLVMAAGENRPSPIRFSPSRLII